MKPYLGAVERFENQFVRPKEGRTLIVGSKIYNQKHDRRLRYQDAIGVDMQEGDGVDVVLDLEKRLPASLGKFQHIECCSVLEHSMKPWLLAANLERLLVPQGTIFVEAPFMWRVHSYPDDYFRFTISGVKSLFQKINWLHAMYASSELSDKAPSTKIEGHPYFARCEVVAFGVKG